MFEKIHASVFFVLLSILSARKHKELNKRYEKYMNLKEKEEWLITVSNGGQDSFSGVFFLSLPPVIYYGKERKEKKEEEENRDDEMEVKVMLMNRQKEFVEVHIS